MAHKLIRRLFIFILLLIFYSLLLVPVVVIKEEAPNKSDLLIIKPKPVVIIPHEQTQPLSKPTESTKLKTTTEHVIRPIKKMPVFKRGSRFSRERNTTALQKTLAEKTKEALERIQQQIIREMKGYDFPNKTIPLDDLIMEKGGDPMRSLIFASWRTGSTFLGSILDSHPAMFYEYEPFLYMDMVQLQTDYFGDEAIQVINGIFTCNYTAVSQKYNIFRYVERRDAFARLIAPAYQREWSWGFGSYDANFRSKLCRMFPFQGVKFVRLRLRLGRTLLEDERFKNKLRIVLLIRDPRAVMNSRMKNSWCTSLDCLDDRLCKNMEDDFEEAKILREKYPDRFMAIRYEEISSNPFEAARKIFQFFRLQFHPQVVKFINATTKTKSIITRNMNVPYLRKDVDVVRDSKTMVSHWIRDLERKDNPLPVFKVQQSCKKAMKMWGYGRLDLGNISRSGSISFSPVLNPPWPEMIVGEINATNY